MIHVYRDSLVIHMASACLLPSANIHSTASKPSIPVAQDQGPRLLRVRSEDGDEVFDAAAVS